ncbi:hypothetical protein AB0425_31495 [Actinosynnema sp. NPDC051121]
MNRAQHGLGAGDAVDQGLPEFLDARDRLGEAAQDGVLVAGRIAFQGDGE